MDKASVTVEAEALEGSLTSRCPGAALSAYGQSCLAFCSKFDVYFLIHYGMWVWLHCVGGSLEHLHAIDTC